MKMSENISVDVYFDPADHEQGFDDEIRSSIHESGPKDV